MKKVLKITETDLHNIIGESVKTILKEYGNIGAMAAAAKRGISRGDAKPYNNAMNSMALNKSGKEDYAKFQKHFEEEDGFNEQPANNLVGENSLKVDENKLFDILRESVKSVLSEIGDTHRFGMGKYGLAMDAASKARSLGRKAQADNLTRHGADAFNQQYGTDNFEMDEFGQLRHRGEDNQERMYRPQSKINALQRQRDSNLQGAAKTHDDALRKNSYIKNAAQTAKAFPRKKMTGGLNAIDTVDKGINGTI